MADLEVFRKHIDISKKQLTDLVIMKFEIDKNFRNKRMDKSRLLAPNDPKDLKKIKNRLVGLVSTASNETLKNFTFLKYKQRLKTALESKMKEVSEREYDDRVENKDKMSLFCQGILTSKYKRHKQL